MFKYILQLLGVIKQKFSGVRDRMYAIMNSAEWEKDENSHLMLCVTFYSDFFYFMLIRMSWKKTLLFF